MLKIPIIPINVLHSFLNYFENKKYENDKINFIAEKH